ncbi:type II secretion system F family protein [Rugamonas sp. FT82W]|uniref:Type II secretion system F family protein n=1 Tax=Duganella vulcania TaxID=2692166 RepID=A0A845G931_9BURK|nr:type II secretion system F family protein [Duganella vulcania]MYM90381.1 type II secretion system F family protein [Duganella vulcania]
MQFKIKTYSLTGGVKFATVDAASELELRQRCAAEGWRIIAISASVRPQLSPRASYSALEFSNELLALIEAGLSLTESLDIQSRKARGPRAKEALAQLLNSLKEGRSFATALAEQPHVFPGLFVTLVKTSEQTGDLAETLKRYISHQQQVDQVRNKVVSASVYPLLLIAVGFLVIAFLLTYVIPRFSRIYEDLGANLPWTSRMMIGWSHFIGHYGGLVATIAIALLSVGGWAVLQASTRARLARTAWSVPGVGEKIRLYQLARFTHTLAMLVNGGMPFAAALGLVTDLLQQPSLSQGLVQARQMINEGRSVSDAFAASSLATEVGVRLIAVGERSGSMGLSLERLARLYDDEIARWVDWFSRLFEPVLMLVIGAAIGAIVILMYMPIFELANTLQ